MIRSLRGRHFVDFMYNSCVRYMYTMLVYVLKTFAYRRPACAHVPTYLTIPASPYSILVTETL
jgi:hypothetical protein